MLEARQLSFSYGRHPVLSGVSLKLTPGKLVALLGTNGAGKSTLLKILTGELDPDQGQVLLEDKPLSAWPTRELAQARAVLPQEPRLAFNFTVRDVVLMGRTPHIHRGETPRDHEICRLALRRVDLQDFAHRYYLELSGGERQRVHLARVLAQIWEPLEQQSRYLLMDEPVAGLDLAHQHGTLRIARELASEGVGVLAILHDINLALAYADETILISGGGVSADGPTAEVLTEERVAEVFNVQAILHRNGDRTPFMQTLPRD
ncbi:heme ABC transporter ATP-binding protein [Ruficoccus amylovorans]|uniref:Heme ABC transporter ATP-binding protein n=1 Tax=Ruficoccus amylovorans TaxID=1804625 RepID=A0A842HHF7_9BACT|nr:heme ABC transporter ATP-binding protein [Ruficoccus amylovorans]MBC2595759.1 heme ABC transporter ATP-binding protein [Ruficoccus amylovorans]